MLKAELASTSGIQTTHTKDHPSCNLVWILNLTNFSDLANNQ